MRSPRFGALHGGTKHVRIGAMRFRAIDKAAVKPRIAARGVMVAAIHARSAEPNVAARVVSHAFHGTALHNVLVASRVSSGGALHNVDTGTASVDSRKGGRVIKVCN